MGTPVWQRLVAAFGVVVTAPVVGASAAAIKLSDPGPAFYRAPRAGIRGTPFVMYKLRTMRVGEDVRGPITASDDDRVLAVGRWLRRFKIDELPQLLNVVTGEMALVGPRPEAIEIVRDFYVPWMMETLDVPPGIAGPGSLHYIQQERGMPGDPSNALCYYVDRILPRKLAYELVFIRSRSFAYELEIIGRTLLKVCGAQVRRRTLQEDEAATVILSEVHESRIQ